MTDKKRPYRKRRRAQLEAVTRRRITESAVELHGTIGPSQTSVSAVAERAGVRRSTVYRHFRDEAALFDACSAHWRAANPRPSLEDWAGIPDPDERLTAALRELYGYYRCTESMLANLLRDEERMPVVEEKFALFRDYLASARATLLRGRGVRGSARRRVGAAIGHALWFETWRSLSREGLDDREAAELMCRLVAAAGARPSS